LSAIINHQEIGSDAFMQVSTREAAPAAIERGSIAQSWISPTHDHISRRMAHALSGDERRFEAQRVTEVSRTSGGVSGFGRACRDADFWSLTIQWSKWIDFYYIA
jgi:hypothetical protein